MPAVAAGSMAAEVLEGEATTAEAMAVITVLQVAVMGAHAKDRCIEAARGREWEPNLTAGPPNTVLLLMAEPIHLPVGIRWDQHPAAPQADRQPE